MSDTATHDQPDLHPPRLDTQRLAALPSSVSRPAYDRAAITPGIVHLGLGAFHRAHQAVYVDACLSAGAIDWGIIGVSLRSPETRDALAPQDTLYALAVRDDAGESLQVIGSVIRTMVAAEDPPALLAQMSDPAIRIVSLTVTEKAYLRDAGGGLDQTHPDIVADLAQPERPRTLFGFIIEALARRRAAGHAPFTVLSCDNLPANGRTLKRLLVAFAGLRDADLARYVAEKLRCPSTMVDRIVPATTDADRGRIAAALGATDAWPVLTEPFRQWVIEDDFASGRPDWAPFGVTMVADVTPFEEMKLRLLNGAHSAIAYLGQVLGHATVAEAFAHPAVRGFVDQLWAETIPTLPTGAGLDPQAYVAALSRRFANSALQHRTAQIANDGSQKLPQRIVAPAVELLGHGRDAAHLSFVIAAWIAALAARRTTPAFTDPLDPQLAPLLASAETTRALVDAVFAVTGFARDADTCDALSARVTADLQTMRDIGPRAALLRAANKDIAS